ncbi:MAG: trypsin-like peptidase domain-containing protein [Candidatus Eremiobacteraeota bacterium]|nr:trypsin-like peptidase domain-containing protein [Candidatus Eremiobacteraeota bacterium]
MINRRLALLVCLCLTFGRLLPATARPASRGLETFESLQALIVELSDKIKPSVVHIEVNSRRGDMRRKGLGSGLIVSSDGKIVTNHHVIDRAEYISVTLDDKTKYEARVLRKDKQTDLALIKIDAKREFPAAKLADSDSVSVGEWVLAIGNPYGFDRTVSFGIVSGKGRYIPGLDSEVQLLNDFIQTDALIDPGSSGGPLINLRGEVLGINSVGIGRGQGFTIPSNVVKEVTTRTEVEGRIERGWIGVYLQPFTREMATYLGIPNTRGIMVSDVQANSPAAAAGVRSGDVITSFNGEAVEAEQDEEINRFAQMVTALEPGKQAQTQVVRDKQQVPLTITVGTQPPVDARETETGLGILVKEITYALYLEFRLDDRDGVLVSYVSRGGAADEAGVEVGDVLIAIDGQPVHDLDSLEKMVPDNKNKAQVMLTLRRGKILRYALLDLKKFSPEETP